MTSPSEDPMTMEELRALTQAPTVDEPLVTPADFDTADYASVRPIWKLPLPKLGLVALLLVPVFALAGYFLVGGWQGNVVDSSLSTSSSDRVGKADAQPSGGDLLNQLQQENEILKASSALDGQAYLLEEHSTPQRTERRVAQPQPDSALSPTRASRPVAVVPQPDPLPPRVASPYSHVPNPSVAGIGVASSSSTPRFDNPMEHWQALAQLGSYGSLPTTDSQADRTVGRIAQRQVTLTTMDTPPDGRDDWPVLASKALPEAMPSSKDPADLPSPAPEAIEGVPTEDSRSSGVESALLGDRLEPVEGDQPLVVPGTSGDLYPSVLEAAEAAILQAETDVRSHIIPPGTTATGHVVTPVILEASDPADRFVVLLTEPLVDGQSRQVIPAGSRLMVQVDQVGENSLVDMSVVEVVWTDGYQQYELTLPSQALQIRGENGNPLVAEQFGDLGAEIGARDMEQFLLGALRRTAELYTRSNTRIQTGDGATVVTATNPTPDILAGVVEGGTDALLDTITERNQQAIEALQDRPSIRWIAAGRSVQVFVNQAVQLPQ